MTRKVVIVNQAANYLTVGFANAFNDEFDCVALITGSVHAQGEELHSDVDVTKINRWVERPVSRKVLSYLMALIKIWVLLMTKFRHHEVVFISVPPMAYLLNIVLPNRFSMVIWDVYPDVLKISGMRESDSLYRAWSFLNRLSFKKAWRLFTISELLAESIGKYVEQRKVIVHPIWSMFQENSRVPAQENPFIDQHQLDGKFVVQYSGNIGESHNVETLVEVAAGLVDETNIVFQIIGKGSRQARVERLVRDRKLSNIQLLPFQTDETFPLSLSAANLGVVILHDSASHGSVPSKAYNLMSFGIPALYIAAADSELAQYASSYSHAVCLASQNIDGITKFISSIAGDESLQLEMQSNAEVAARDFRRSNADLFVSSYLNEQALGR